MKYGVTFLLLALFAIFAGFAAVNPASRVVAALVGLAMLIVATAYLMNRPRLLGKRPDGRLAWWSWLVLWPYFALVWVSFLVYQLIDRRPPVAEVVPGLWLSRRLSMRQSLAASSAWSAIVDLTSEFPRTRIPDAAYLSIAVLDGTPPTMAQLTEGNAFITAHQAPGPVLVHCALGHGRSASVVIAWLLATCAAPNLDAAVAMVKAARPGVGLNPAQFVRVGQFAALLDR